MCGVWPGGGREPACLGHIFIVYFLLGDGNECVLYFRDSLSAKVRRPVFHVTTYVNLVCPSGEKSCENDVVGCVRQRV